MPQYDFLVVGSGMFGAVFARHTAERGKRVLVIEKRAHVGGNCYTENVEGIHVHMYGPHIFHTSDDKVWQYVNRFTKFNHFVNRPKVVHKGRLYSFPINLMTLYQLWNVKTPAQAKEKLENVVIRKNNPKNLEEWVLSQVGEEIYEIFIKGYTKKQWGKEPKNLPASIIRRVPIRLTFDDNYYDDKYQGIPVGGYTELFARILDGVDVILNTDYFADRKHWDSIAAKVIYTGKIDEYFDYRFGELEYRGLRFETKVFAGDYQGNAVINYTEEQVPYTRVIEHKHFDFKNHDRTVVTWEYPERYGGNGVPSYPINDKKNCELYIKYKEEAGKREKLFLGGRLATYTYLDMDDAVGAALAAAEELTS